MILSRVKFYPQERVDLEDFTTLLSAARTDSKLWTKQILSGENYILKGFTVSGLGLKQATIEMDNASMFMGQGSQDFSYFIAENNPTDIIVSDSDLVDGARNYVELALSYEDGTPITKAFWDPSANGGLGAEFNQQVNTVTDLQATVSVAQGGFSGDPDKLPLCIIDTDVSGNIKVILDRRNLFFRLGSPSDPDQGFTWTSNEEPGYSVNLTGVSGTFTAGETVTFSGGTTATVATGGTSNIVVRLPSSLSFASGNTLTGGSSGATGTVNTILEAFGGADKDIDDIREMFMALATEIRRLKGTPFWHNIQGNSMDGLSSILNMAIVGLTAGARWSWSGTALSITDNDGTPASTDDLARIRLFGKSQNITLRRADGTASTSTIAIADGEMLFVKLPSSGNRNFSGNGSGDSNYQIVDADDYEINDTNFWLAYREGAKLYVRGYGELMSGESAEISDPISEQILTFIGATSEADDAPNYTSTNVVIQGSSLVAAISSLDTFAGALTWKAPVANIGALPVSGNTDGDARITLDTRIIYTWVASATAWRPITGGGAVKLVNGGVFSVSGSGTLNLTFTADINLEMKGLAYADNIIPFSTQSPIAFASDGQVAWVTPNYASGGPALTVTVGALTAVPANAIIVARRVGNDIIVGSSSTRLSVGQSSELYAQESVQTRNYIRSFDYLRSDEPVTWTGSQIQFTQNIVLEQLNTRLGTTRTRTILVANSPISLTDGQVAYVEIDRAAANGNVTPSVSSSIPTPSDESKEIIILAKRIDVSGAGYLHLPLHKQVLNPGQTVRLGASGSGSDGDAVASSPIEGYQWRESDSFTELPSSSNSKVTSTSYTNASFNIAKSLFKLSCDKTRAVTTSSGTSLIINGLPSFTVAVGDIVYITSGLRTGQWRRILTVNGQNDYVLDAAFTGGNAANADTLMVSQAVWTKDLVNFGSASEKTRARDFFSGNISQIAVAYEDSITTDDDVPNLADPACVVVGASNSGLVAATGVPTSDTFGNQIFTRPTGAAQLNDFVLSSNANQERLHLCFFPNPSNVSVTTQANLLGYEANFYAETTSLNAGVLENAIAFSDNSTTPYNATVSSTSGLTQVTLTWSYVPAVKSGGPDGQVKVVVDGKEVSRFISSAITPSTDLYYTEVAGAGGVYNIIQFTKDISSLPLEIKIRKQMGVVDSSTQNNTDIALLKTGPTIQRFLSGSGTYTKPANVRWIKVRIAGGGGGGAGSGNAAGNGTTGNASTFGSLLTATGGGPGLANNINGRGGGGSPTVNSPAVALVSVAGGDGHGQGGQAAGLNLGSPGGAGGANPLGGAGAAGGSSSGAVSAGGNGVANTGAGGGGGGSSSNGGTVVYSGSGGGAGAYIEAIILNPSSSYSYTVGSGGGGGAAGGGGGGTATTGGNGASGVIIIEEYY